MEKLKASDLIEIDEDFLDQISARIEAKKREKEVRTNTFYTTEQVAKIVSKDVRTIGIHIRNHINGLYEKTTLKATKSGRNWLISQENLDKYLKRGANEQ